VFQLRERRPRFGELVQIDGSHHAWLEDRGPRLALIVFIDDATGRLTAMRFAATETAHAYRLALRDHVVAHGLPLALYSDRHGISRMNAKDAVSGAHARPVRRGRSSRPAGGCSTAFHADPKPARDPRAPGTQPPAA
jgi:hypothetical protein